MQITRYSEINVDSNAIHLTNNIGAIGLVGVGFSHPSGTLQINDFAQFTHFTATFEGTTYVYKVNGFNAINSGVCEVTYSLDYLKDYFFKHTVAQLQSGNGLMTRSTVESQWSKYASDDKALTTGKVNSYNLSAQVSVATGIFYVVVIKKAASNHAGFEMYSCSESSITALYHQAAYIFADTGEATENEKKIAIALNQIVAIYAMPDNAGSGNTVSIPFPYNTADTDSITLINVNGQKINNPNFIKDYTLRTLSYADFRAKDFRKVNLYAPLIGTLTVPVADFVSNGNSTPVIRYTFNLVDGTVGASWKYPGDDNPGANMLLTAPLPQLPIPSSTTASSILRESLSYQNNINSATVNAAGSAASGAIGGMLMGTKMGSAAGPAGMAIGALSGLAIGLTTNLVNANNSHTANMSAISASAASFNGSAAGFTGIMNPMFRYAITEMEVEFNPDVYGYVVNHKLSERNMIANNKYWLDISTNGIGGPDWYTAGVKDAINNSYILIN